VETDRDLAALFDRWREAGAADLARYGTRLGRKEKATIVGALIWRRHRNMLGPELAEALQRLYQDVDGERRRVESGHRLAADSCWVR
jgi:hypothetical protein